MKFLRDTRHWFKAGNASKPASRALLLEQFRILTSQIPILYGVTIVDGISIAYVAPPSFSWWLRFGAPAALLLISAVRLAHWVTLRGSVANADQVLRYLSVMRIRAVAVNTGFSLWALALFDSVGLESRAPLALLVFMGSVGSAYCLASFPAAARLTLLLSGVPISVRLLLSTDPQLICIGLNLCMLLLLFVHMMNGSYRDLVKLVASQAKSLAQGERARKAEADALLEHAKTNEIASRFDSALNNISQGLCFFDGERRLIVCNRRYIEMYDLPPESVRPGMLLTDIVALRYQAGSCTAMSKEDYLLWCDHVALADEPTDATVELANGRVFLIRHRPMPDRGWVATHEDVTERHRAEQALADAKANAERAELAARTAHATLIDALNVIPEGLAILDAEDRYVLWNRQYAEIYAQSRDVLTPGMRFEETLRAGLACGQYPDAKGREEQWLAERLARHALPQSTHEQPLPGDRWIRIEERRTADGGSIGIRIDITDLKRREASFRLLFEENPLPMWVADARTRQLLAANAAMCRHYGYSCEDLLRMSEQELECGSSDVAAGDNFELHRTRGGDRIEVAIESRPLLYEGRAAHVSVAFDVTDRNRAQERISYLASHDALTELPNRTALDQHLIDAIERAQVTVAGFAVLCIDLDHFKEINDLFGHAIGDAVLREASRRLQEAAEGSYVARIGGDEFIVITDQVPLPAIAELLATKMRAAFEGPVEIDGHALRIDLCIGIALFPRDADNAVSLLANADAALYRAKHEGRGTIRLFTSAMDQQLRDRRALEHDLRFAVERGELYLEYQPQQHKDGSITGYEALVRWQHPVRGIVSPGEFIPIAERSGSIAEIDDWVLIEACREAASWTRPLRVAVNISAAQFRQENLDVRVRKALRDSGLSPSRLELEITEGVLIEDISRAKKTMRSLKCLGILIALDDFGTGYSSLSYLEAFPLDRIKIDRSFVAALGRSMRSLAIIRAVIGLAHGLGVPVLAEGIEQPAQMSLLLREGCDEMQGYLIGRPHRLADSDIRPNCTDKFAARAVS